MSGFIVRTTQDFPFDQLSPNDFHRLVFMLADRDTTRFHSVEDSGQKGNDRGIDMWAISTTSPRHRIGIQAKRTQSLDRSDIAAEITRLDGIPAEERPKEYILVTSSVPTDATRVFLRREAKRIGIDEAEIWNRTKLSSMLLRHDDLIVHFFGEGALSALVEQTTRHLIEAARSRGVVLIIGRGDEISPTYPSLESVDGVIESIIEDHPTVFTSSVSAPAATGRSFLESVFPSLSSLVHGRITLDRYLRLRLEAYSRFDADPVLGEPLTACLDKHDGGGARLPAHEAVMDLITSHVIKGVIQLSWTDGLRKGVVERCGPGVVIEGAARVQRQPFFLRTGRAPDGKVRLIAMGGEIMDRLSAVLAAPSSQRPIIVGVNLSHIDIVQLGATLVEMARSTEVHIVGRDRTIQLDDCLYKYFGDPVRVLDKLSSKRRISPFHRYCRTIDYTGAPSWERIISSEPFQPEDTAIACEPPSITLAEQIVRDRGYHLIFGPPGSGKTAKALFIARRFHDEGYSIKLVSCSDMIEDDVTLDEFEKFLQDLDGFDVPMILIVEDFHTRDALRADVINALDKNSISLKNIGILLVYANDFKPYIISEGQIQRDIAVDYSLKSAPQDYDSLDRDWPSTLSGLLDWAADNEKDILKTRGERTIPYQDLRRTFSQWHFFYVLRGGSRRLSNELAFVRSQGDFDLIWLGVCLWTIFIGQTTIPFHSLVEFSRAHGLFPQGLPSRNLDYWVRDGLRQLSHLRLVVIGSQGFAPRHMIEASSLIRIGFVQNGWLIPDIVARLLRERITKPNLSKRKMGSLIAGAKYEVYQVIDDDFAAIIQRATQLDLATVNHPLIEDVYRDAWSDLVEAMEAADLHHLYWITNRINSFTYNSLRYPPIVFVGSLPGLSAIRDGSGVMDFVTVVNFGMSRELIRRTGLLYTMANMPALDAAREWVEMMRDADTHFQKRRIDQPGSSTPSAGDRIKLEKRLRHMERDIGQALEKVREMIDTGLDDIRSDLYPPESDAAGLASLMTNIQAGKLDLVRWEFLGKLVGQLEEKRQTASSIASRIDIQDMATRITALYDSGVAPVFFHLWLMTPGKARELYDWIGEGRRNHLVELLLDEKARFSTFECAQDEPLFDLFVHWWSEFDTRVAEHLRWKRKSDKEYNLKILDIRLITQRLAETAAS
ncbi:hypothetical protein N825_23200 [Skermanella stibiiresistens SB22]|uniref:Restriction endonuclease type IV Mrr domain-containing protein n=1 Tax=Skermanella stibiiresistens SB22 TaxID=1385369 RepID=W9GW70_9PROT|nr:ATP-binding protein [Skermanella stibiiresistens]EWY36901.1 hypothetical protein N825_23200 [Skermanella stibiiresistens SB22]